MASDLNERYGCFSKLGTPAGRHFFPLLPFNTIQNGVPYSEKPTLWLWWLLFSGALLAGSAGPGRRRRLSACSPLVGSSAFRAHARCEAPSPYVTVEFAGCLVKTSIGASDGSASGKPWGVQRAEKARSKSCAKSLGNAFEGEMCFFPKPLTG